MIGPGDFLNYDVPEHFGEHVQLPCFACFLETVLEAAGNIYDDDGQAAYDKAMMLALRQMADGIGSRMAVLMPDFPTLRDEFVSRLDRAGQMGKIDASGSQH